ncbi:hypothetical protein [Saccharibacillus kuerlensis]|uniref:Phage protein n=1 Tax=Saccharibacillus kuerlensis TaxID=459527 RepID=A0ABQ2KTG0_9BACL|nr:hypothetical protein [Saccharibacillus kuerlensis]GGN92093.1 hypothetical protein GCM10010969_04210 [Saccharibacillus kuerlensis]
MLGETLLEEVKAAVDRCVQKSISARAEYFGEIRQADGIFEPHVLPIYSPVQIYAQLETALGILGFVFNNRTKQQQGEIKIYLNQLQIAVHKETRSKNSE